MFQSSTNAIITTFNAHRLNMETTVSFVLVWFGFGWCSSRSESRRFPSVSASLYHWCIVLKFKSWCSVIIFYRCIYIFDSGYIIFCFCHYFVKKLTYSVQHCSLYHPPSGACDVYYIFLICVNEHINFIPVTYCMMFYKTFVMRLTGQPNSPLCRQCREL